MQKLRSLISSIALTLLIALPVVGVAQDDELDPIAVDGLFQDIRARLATDADESSYLASARASVIAELVRAEDCEIAATVDRTRYEALYEPLKNIDGEVETSVFEQFLDLKIRLDESIQQQAQCASTRDAAQQLINDITAYQNRISQQFLSHRDNTIIGAMRELPFRLAAAPENLRNSASLNLQEGITPILLIWVLFAGGALAAIIGVVIRHRFHILYQSAGGDEAPPQFKYLFVKPLAEHAPLLLEGVTLAALLGFTIENPSADLIIVRLAISLSLYGLTLVIIDWATGPLSPAAAVKGLIPDHVKPLRNRARIFAFMLVASFVVLGTRWLAIRTVAPDVPGRATMIFLVAISLLNLSSYLSRIPGLFGRFRLLRFVTTLGIIAGIVALLIGYQNFAGFLIHGFTRTALALFLLWILLWCSLMLFQYLIKRDTPSANEIRRNLGVTDKATRTGLGFIQLFADLLVWVGFVVFLLYVWDASGATLDSLYEQVINGISIGQLRLVPINIINGILIFIAMLIVIGWIKRWIDRRWLQQIGIERGAREALITIFGYIGFVVAVLVGLTQTGLDLAGLAWVSGALALGIGFGMQEIANNFVSGLILLFERPIRTGDFVSVGNVDGFVRSIRIRATEIETMDNQNVLVPNSELISGRVTNWVLRDTAGRLQLKVGVAYGSDVEKVRDILEAVSREHSEVITDGSAPAPRALFMGFGDSSLDFELRVRVYRIDRRFSILSDLNFAIDAAFREAGITIPFPQHDLHVISYPAEEKPPAPVAPVQVPESHPPHVDSITRSFVEVVELTSTLDETWNALTDADMLNKWLTKECQIQARIGGSYSLTFRDGAEDIGRFDVFVPRRRMRWVSSPFEHEEPIPSGPITTDYRLRKIENGTEITVSISGIPADEDWEEDYNRSEARWKQAVADLRSALGDGN